jgi:hypothetical protein
MASSPPIPAAGRFAQFSAKAMPALGGVATAFLGGLFAAIFTYYFTAKLNHESAVQQQYLAAIQEFATTGANVDASITELADTILDGAEITQARKEARQAIAAHVAATQGIVQIVGQGNADAYMVGLATLRKMVDNTGDVGAALKTSQARFDLMDNRTIIIDEARKRTYADS